MVHPVGIGTTLSRTNPATVDLKQNVKRETRVVSRENEQYLAGNNCSASPLPYKTNGSD
jgi:hypothetical protein